MTFIKRVLALGALAAIVLATALLGLGNTSASATTWGEGGDVHHLSDAGYDRAIIVFCSYGAPWSERDYVEENSNSSADCGVDTDQIYIRAGEELWCRNVDRYGTISWFKSFDAEGRHKIIDTWNEDCVLKVD